MTAWIRRASVWVLACGAIVSMGSPVISRSGAKAITGPAPVAELPPVVRVRRLHLVRPDLIPYPIDIEVFC